MKARFSQPSSEQLRLEAQVEQARRVVGDALEKLRSRKRKFLTQLKIELDGTARTLCTAKIADLNDAIRLHKRELNQLYPDRIKVIARAQAITPRTSWNGEATSKITLAKPYRG